MDGRLLSENDQTLNLRAIGNKARPIVLIA
jgi:hypothetical protein